jgi:hypothetical protein
MVLFSPLVRNSHYMVMGPDGAGVGNGLVLPLRLQALKLSAKTVRALMRNGFVMFMAHG